MNICNIKISEYNLFTNKNVIKKSKVKINTNKINEQFEHITYKTYNKHIIIYKKS